MRDIPDAPWIGVCREDWEAKLCRGFSDLEEEEEELEDADNGD